MLRIGMLTSGGDCQALNATMRGVVKGLSENVKKLEIYGFLNGYRGLIYSDFRLLDPSEFSGILTQGGTILGTSRVPFKTIREPDENGLDKVEAMKQNYYKLKLDCLVVLGGSPDAYDRVLCSRLGAAGAQAILDEDYGNMIGIINGETTRVPLNEVAGKLKTVDPDCSLIKEARMLGISFGDR